MTDRRLRELVALDAAGALVASDRARLDRLLETAPESVRLELAALYDSAARLPAALALDTPSADVRARILAHASRHEVR